MFFISKSVADGIHSLGEREDVKRELEAIRATPGFEVYANAIAEGLRERRAHGGDHSTKARTTERTRSGG